MDQIQAGREIMRLNNLSREFSDEKLLDEALAGRQKDKDTLCRLYRFVLDNFGPADSPYSNRPGLGSQTTLKFWKAIETHLIEFGVSAAERNKIRKPSPRFGEPGFKSIFDEMLENGEISQEDFDEIHTRKGK